MLDDVQKAVGTRLPSVAVAAFRTAIYQQEAVDEISRELRAREREAEREATAERRRNLREEAVQLIGAVDEKSEGGPDPGVDAGLASDTEPGGQPESRELGNGRVVDVKV